MMVAEDYDGVARGEVLTGADKAAPRLRAQGTLRIGRERDRRKSAVARYLHLRACGQDHRHRDAEQTPVCITFCHIFHLVPTRAVRRVWIKEG